MSKLKQIIRLRGEGITLKAIAKAVDTSRNTVKISSSYRGQRVAARGFASDAR